MGSLSLETGQLVFVRDEAEGWIPATVGDTRGQGMDMSLDLHHEDGSVERITRVDGERIQQGDPSCQKGVDDMVKMDILTVGSVLHNLRTRYSNRDIYTAVGSILVAINPYERIHSLYDEERMRSYADMATDDAISPHPYALMELAYRGLMMDQRSQSVLISGESGAGKTETTKYLLSYLSYRSSSIETARRAAEPEIQVRRGLSMREPSVRQLLEQVSLPENERPKVIRRNSIGGRFSVEDSVVMSNPVMEAFANAKTTRNHNSSRFGKYIQVTLHPSGVVTGGRVTTYLLEKTRVARQLPGERSYHVFYQLCEGADPEMRQRLGLKKPIEFRSLTGGGCVDVDTIDDAESFGETCTCMESIGLGTEAQEGVFRVVAAVLHLLSVEFVGVDIPGQDIGSRIDDSSEGSSLHWASKLLGLKPEQLEEALVTRLIEPGGSSTESCVVVPSSPMVAEQARDAVAKALYSALFDWLVEKINLTLTAAITSKTAADKTNNRFIGLLDIFGFEAFGTNSLEQLLINYANERLQQQFNAFVFKLEEKEFASEGLSSVYVEQCRVEFADNDDVLRLLEDRHSGLLSLLKEESTLKTGTGLRLGKRYRQTFAHNDRFAVPRVRGGAAGVSEALFGVVHFAGEVVYDATEFVEKNRDEVPPVLHDLVLSSNDKFVANLLQDYAGDLSARGGARGKRRGPPMGLSHRRLSSSTMTSAVASKGRPQKGTVLVTGKFMGSLGSLMTVIGETEPHYIRCVKPNEDQLPMVFQGAYILEQLNWMGMVQIVEIRQRGFSVRYPHSEFVGKYGRIVGRGPGQPGCQGPVGSPNPAEWRDESERVAGELVHLGHMEQGLFHLGNTKIFLRTATQRTLDAAREEYVRQEAETMLTAAISERDKEALASAVALATQLRLRSPQVQEAKLLILELNREEALTRVNNAIEEEDFDALIKAVQAAGAIGVKDSDLESGKKVLRDIQRRKELMARMRTASVGAGRCLEEGGDPQPHLTALDPILAELAELGTRLKKMPRAEMEDWRAIRNELKTMQEAPVLQAMEKEMTKPEPDMGKLRSLIVMATEEVGVELGVDTVDRCKELLEKAEREAEAVAEDEEVEAVAEEVSLEEKEAAEAAAAAAALLAKQAAEAAARAEVEAAEAEKVAAAQERSLQETAPTTYEALTRLRPEKEDPVAVARQMDILVPEPVALAIRRAYEDSLDGSLVRRSRSASMLQEALERLIRDLQMNGIKQIPTAPLPRPPPRPAQSQPKEEGKEEYPYRHIPLYTANFRNSYQSGLHQSTFELLEMLKKGTPLLKVSQGKFSKRKTTSKVVRLSDDHSQLSWSNEGRRGAKPDWQNATSIDLKATGSAMIKEITIGLGSPILLKEWEGTPSRGRLSSEWLYFSLHTPARTYDFGSEDASTVLRWCLGLCAVIPQLGAKPPLCRAQTAFARNMEYKATREEPVPLCPLLWPIARQIASTANDLGINDPCYRHHWSTAVELVEAPLPEGFSRVVQDNGLLRYRWPKSSSAAGNLGPHPHLDEFMAKIDYDSKLNTNNLRPPRSSGSHGLAPSHPIRCFVGCFKGDLTAIRRFANEGGDVECRYEDAYERPWLVAMGGPDYSWAEPGLGTNPLNYTLAFCDIIGADTAAGVVSTLLELGADVNKDDGDPEIRYTPLHSAVGNEVPSLVRTVLEHGARVNTPRGDRRIPIHTAMRLPAGKKKLGILSTLLVIGGDIDRPEPFQGNTPLHMACKMGDTESVELLLEAGADILVLNGGQRTASELVRLEVTELEDCINELDAEVGVEEDLSGTNTSAGSHSTSGNNRSRSSVDHRAELGRTRMKLEKVREIGELLEAWMPAEEDGDMDVEEAMTAEIAEDGIGNPASMRDPPGLDGSSYAGVDVVAGKHAGVGYADGNGGAPVAPVEDGMRTERAMPA